jgi:eukaryotic-like serine/threonine-protein kinase
MTPERFRQVREIFERAGQLAAEPRKSYLHKVCSEEAGLLLEVERMLEAERFTGPLDRPALQIVAQSIHAEVASISRLPTGMGRYRILGVLGEGGMGVVYEAEQDQPRRTVALKVIKPGLAGPDQLRRFERESQALARLQHPGIAQVYEAGTADSGCGPQPYFAMEFIRGESLLRYAESHDLNTRQRLELIAKVCEAVHHAHQRGIIHRDLKPANILVDESGQPKVLDFGVARVTDSDAQATRQTDVER